MRRKVFALAIVIGFANASAIAENVKFEISEKPFESSAVAKRNTAIFSYDSSLYDGLWPMTIEAFKKSDWNVDEDIEVYAFSIAFNR
jgi:hypothetical protein